jgi:7-cyano-7-deazaguanine synthase in queuosine biosynthesis
MKVEIRRLTVMEHRRTKGYAYHAAVGTHAEPTYRTRTFLFFCMAVLAAVKIKSTRVIVGENGIGALGPSMIAYGSECPHRTTHPAFTRRLASFLNELLETNIAFEHPQVERTKGEVLARALSLGISGWQITNSCVRGPRDQLDNRACGACSGCLLRRMACLAAGIDPMGYFWEDLGASSLDNGRSSPVGREAMKNDRDIVYHGVHAMSEFAELAKLDPEAKVFQRAAWEWKGPTQENLAEASRQVHRLVQAHAKEWNALRDYFGNSAIFNFKQAS